MNYVTYFILILSWLFLIFGMIAIFRLKNVYTRILTAATIDTVASFLMLFALMIAAAQYAYGIRLFVLVIFLMITNPISSHVNIRSAYLIGVPIHMKDGDQNE
ncbi:MAG: monovalent cation/H(+) antiporter subunit G [Tenericutes bacterium]|nr:monovalent cation/H(+) antiporter subunit G [Mycoplasmatota bacterium]